VYLIDEVHMLSTHSFNALLKTLEEPPPHVKFLLATTDPQKLPVTVLSRCLQFNLKRIPVAQIAGHLRAILEKEGIGFEPAGLALVAQAADGSMRDGLSLLDQLIAFGGGRAGEAEARAMLGTVARDHVLQLADRLATADAAELLRYARALDEWAPDYAQMLDELGSLLVRIALKQVVKDFEGDDLYTPEVLERLAAAMAPEDVQLYYQTAIVGRRDLALAPDPRTGFEMALLRMVAFRPQAGAGTGAGPAPVSIGRAPGADVASGRPAGAAPGARGAGPGPAVSRVEQGPGSRPGAKPAGPTAPAPAAPPGAQDWAAIIAALELQGAARQLAAHCVLVGREGAVVRLALDPRSKFMRTPAVEEKLAQALAKYYGELIRLEFTAVAPQAETPAQADQRASQEEAEAARRAFESDPGVQGFRDRFGATPLPETIRPVKS
jgi:DNA polymerase-3 subunit gamma/tau